MSKLTTQCPPSLGSKLFDHALLALQITGYLKVTQDVCLYIARISAIGANQRRVSQQELGHPMLSRFPDQFWGHPHLSKETPGGNAKPRRFSWTKEMMLTTLSHIRRNADVGNWVSTRGDKGAAPFQSGNVEGDSIDARVFFDLRWK